MRSEDITNEARAAAVIREALAGEDDEALTLDMIEGETDFLELLDALEAADAHDKALREGLKARVSEARERGKRLAHRVERREKLILRALDVAGLPKVERPGYTLSKRMKSQSVVLSPDAEFPDELVRIRRKPNKTAIKAALQAGQDVEGATLSQGGEPSLQIRRK